MGNVLNVSKKRLGLIGAAAGAGLTAVLLSLFISGSLFAAFPLAGIGGFTISADEIEGTDFSLYPAIGETAEYEDWAQAGVDLGTADIHGLVLSKNIDTEDALGAYGVNSVDVQVTSSGVVEGDNLSLMVSGIDAVDSQFTSLEVSEHYTDDPMDSFDLAAPELLLDDAELNTHYLSADSIGIPGLQVQVISNTEDGSIGGF
ncbi:hypothetical protein HUG15_02495 [Salicibibacter cibarius]|uniref:Uncharacterized protein n=1 Tax=Salicibibacter cibarius TaxID=2743000 RepID=A0A7T6Z088_9BACI|nr:DUF6230 family protein [Salicibibacter cibarius]QQK74581.1 hypothetical protein HUG15_02495 [Salicibibacter cibarius]